MLGKLGGATLIKMPNLYTVPNITEGMDNALIETAATIPSFIPMFLVFVFAMVFISGIISQKRRGGTADVPVWAAIASLATFMICLPMTLAEGLVTLPILSIVIVITILSGFWLFTSRTKNEV